MVTFCKFLINNKLVFLTLVFVNYISYDNRNNNKYRCMEFPDANGNQEDKPNSYANEEIKPGSTQNK